MTIPVDCPHCETRFQLNPDLLGKSMRCPECREVFVVQQAAAPPAPAPVPAAAEQPFERIESDGVGQPEVFREPAPAAAPPPADLPTLQPLPDDPPDVPTLQPLPDPSIYELPLPAAQVRTAAPKPAPPVAPSLPAPKEMAWTGDAPPPATPARPAPARGEDDDKPFIRRRRRRRLLPKLLLTGVSVLLAGTLIATGVGLYRHYVLTEEHLAQEAEAAYKDGNYPTAQKKYEELLTRFSGSSDADRYRFFAALSETQAVVGAVTARENPAPAIKSFNQFVEAHGQSPLAAPETGYGADVVQAGRKLADVIADHAGDRLKNFRADRKKLDELAAAEQAVRDGRALLPVVDKFRDKEAGSLDAQRKRYDELDQAFAAERHRLEVLEPFRTLSKEPTAERIEAFQTALKDNNLTGDAEAQQMLGDAERRLRELLGYARKAVPAVAVPADLPTPVLFAAPVAGSPDPRPAPDVPPDVVFAVARGVLYALDAQTGGLLWGTRVAPPTADFRTADLPVRVPIGGASDWVLIAGEADGKPGLTARVARTGEPVWYQPLDAPPAGRPAVIGGRVYVPLRDPLGRVLEFETATGARSGELALRQPVGGGIAVLPSDQRGISYLFIPGDARRVFVFEVGREDAEGRHLDPRCARVILTDHPRDSLRGEPVLVTPADEAGPRFLILAQTDGPTGMKLRAFPLPAPGALAGNPDGPAEESAPRATEVSVPGWAWFPARSDGERVVLATDAGAFLAFGLNQAGNADAPLFTLPTPKPPGEPDAVARSQVVAAEEDAYWAVLNGRLVRLRTAIDPLAGFRIALQGVGRQVGEPVNRPQVLPGMGLGVVVVRPGGSAGVQAVGFDLQTGQVRWQRRLGAAPAGPPVVARDSGTCVVADEDAGVYAVAPAAVGPGAGTGLAAEVVARPLADLAGRAVVAGSADGRTAWVLAPEADDNGRRLRVRCVTDGRLSADAVVPLPDKITGAPVALGDSVLVPLANGYVYRFTPGGSQLTVGPLWRGEGGETVCFLAPVGDDEFLATDGGRRFLRWKWPAGHDARAEKVAGPWEMRAKIAIPPAAVASGSQLRFAAADVTGAVYLFDADNPGGEPVRRWRGGDKSPIPAGQPTQTISVATAGGKSVLLYSIDRRHLVALDPDRAAPAWVKRDLVPAGEGDLTGWAATAGRVVATDQSGRVATLDAATGKEIARTRATTGGQVAVGPAVPLTAQVAIVMLDDGSAATVPLPSLGNAVPIPKH